MADLIAQGADPQQRWRRPLPVGKAVTVGRESGWATPWDGRISRQHAQVVWDGQKVVVKQLSEARNPIFFGGRSASEFAMRPGDHFVIGTTTFTVLDEPVNVSIDLRQPMREQTFSPQYLRKLRFRDADQRIEILSRLPEVISGAVTDPELFVRVVNLLLLGIPRADAAALVTIDHAGEADEEVHVLHWDRRLNRGGQFQPSRRLILESVHRGESVMHVWSGSTAEQVFTAGENVDWAFCTPVHGEACRGWGIYVAGHFVRDAATTPSSDPADLRDDLKFTELVAATLSSLRQVQLLSKRHAGLTQFFSPVVLEALATDPEAALAPRETEVTVVFCDLRGFSLKSERAASDLMGLLNRVSKALGVVTHQILDHGGVVGDFQGDAVMGFWGWPIASADAVQNAAIAALGIRAEFEAAAGRGGHPLADFRVGIGVATGRAVAGKIGTVDQVKVTVFGPVVNLASRLEGMTKAIHAPILLDEATGALIRERVPRDLARCRRVAVVKPFGLEKPLEVTELLPPVTEYPELTDAHLADYEAALDALLSRRWPEAFELLHRVPAVDRVKDFLTVFIAQHHRTPPENWDGVIPLTAK